MSENARIKVVMVGDGGCGKTSVLRQFTGHTFETEYTPTMIEMQTVNMEYKGNQVELDVWDFGDVNFECHNPEHYVNTHVVLMFFAINDQSSLKNVVDTWTPLLRRLCPEAAMVLVGNKKDKEVTICGYDKDRSGTLRRTFSKKKTIYPEQGRAIAATLGAHEYCECSAKENEGVKKVFETAVDAVATQKEAQLQQLLRRGMSKKEKRKIIQSMAI